MPESPRACPLESSQDLLKSTTSKREHSPSQTEQIKDTVGSPEFGAFYGGGKKILLLNLLNSRR
jgi:hypothetical protein